MLKVYGINVFHIDPLPKNQYVNTIMDGSLICLIFQIWDYWKILTPWSTHEAVKLSNYKY